MGWWSKCREFLEEMDRMGVQKDLHSYSIYMDIQCKSGKPWKAVKLYKEMKKKGIELDVVAYNTVVHAMGRSEGIDFAIRLYREMMELGCVPNVVTYNTIIKLLCEDGRVREASKVRDQMCVKGCAPNVITYKSIFGYLEKPREILKLFDKMMMASGVHPRMDTYGQCSPDLTTVGVKCGYLGWCSVHTGAAVVAQKFYEENVGSVVLYTIQGKFHSSTSDTLDYVVSQADTTVQNLRNVSDYLAAAKHIRVGQVLLPPDVQNSIDKVNSEINASATALERETKNNKKNIEDVLDSVCE
ncbi:pentatricopeptide repeat (PPR) superfamily protein [Actinidia rufa]|uniref:Pentatricopeptide repeat (PPR) superfamily protein n=1 Tax=Actinidia rufa TaxID=165716 RepID=A0A7J0H289_9ERIC|nr:pentatricopeptide repeat (PPR) superfamily protein [Actinidia rufa]